MTKRAWAAVAIVCFCAAVAFGATKIITSRNAQHLATCVGATPCKACKNCKYCKHCSQDGGTCGTKPAAVKVAPGTELLR